MYRDLRTAHWSFCSSRIAPTKRAMAPSFGKIPTTSVRSLISPLTRSIGLVECNWTRCGPASKSGPTRGVGNPLIFRRSPSSVLIHAPGKRRREHRPVLALRGGGATSPWSPTSPSAPISHGLRCLPGSHHDGYRRSAERQWTALAASVWARFLSASSGRLSAKSR